MTAASVIAVIVSVLALGVSIAGLVYARRSASNSERSARAAESVDRHARTPRLAIELSGKPGLVDRVIYSLRNEGLVDLTEVTVFRPVTSDGVIYPLAVTGSSSGWERDEIRLGAIAVANERRFTLSCGAAEVLPEFRARIEASSGSDRWVLTQVLPSPRPTISEEDRRSRRELLASALEDIHANLVLLSGDEWARTALRDDRINQAHELIVSHAPDHAEPVGQARAAVESFRSWVGGPVRTWPENQVRQRVDGLRASLRGAQIELENLSAALAAPQASGARWRD